MNSETKLHERLYKNLFLLNMQYPPSKLFQEVFKRDMFVKKNKAAFFQVIYYLLNILNPEVIQVKLSTWPTGGNITRENKFRTDLLKYINELNILYENADIPVLMASHLIAPGGLKFVHFMCKLSELVVYTHLSRTLPSDSLLLCKPSGNIKLSQSTHLKHLINEIKCETKNLMHKFEEKYIYFQTEADKTVDEQIKLNNELKNIQVQFASPNLTNQIEQPSTEELEGRMCVLREKIEKIDSIVDIFKHCCKFVSFLKSGANVLEYDKEKHNLPTTGGTLNLIEFFQSLNTALQHHTLQFPFFNKSELVNYLEELKSMENEYLQYEKEISDHHHTIMEAMEQSMHSFSNMCNDTNQDSECLAEPLEISLEIK